MISESQSSLTKSAVFLVSIAIGAIPERNQAVDDYTVRAARPIMQEAAEAASEKPMSVPQIYWLLGNENCALSRTPPEGQRCVIVLRRV